MTRPRRGRPPTISADVWIQVRVPAELRDRMRAAVGPSGMSAVTRNLWARFLAGEIAMQAVGAAPPIVVGEVE